MLPFLRLFLLAAATSALAPVAHGTDTWFVRKDASGAATGQNWSDAFTDLQAALAVADSGDQIWVAAGTYPPDEAGVDQTKTFSIPAGVSVYGGFAGTELVLSQRNPLEHKTVLDGDLMLNDLPGYVNYSDNSDRVVVIVGGSDPAELHGLTVRGGRGPNSAPLFAHAGGITVNNSAAILVCCSVQENRTSNFTGGSGGMTVIGTTVVTLIDCLFMNNRTDANGGALRVASGASMTAINCRFVANRAINGGGAIDCFNALGRLVNCLFSGNKSSNAGGGVQVWGSEADIVHCTFAANEAGPQSGGGGVATVNPGPVRLVNSILWGNSAGGTAFDDDQVDADSQTALESCCLQPPQLSFGGTNLTFLDPLFVDPLGPDLLAGTLDDDYRLMPLSPSIDAGTNQIFALDVLDLDCDSITNEPTPVDLLIAPRYVDQLTIDTGIGPPPIADIGAYEFSGWTHLGYALEGTGGVVPCATGAGDWIPGRDIGLDLRRGPPGGLAAVVLSTSIAKLPFRGGVLVPAPEEAFVTILDGQGHVLLSDTVPMEQPLGSLIVLQPWFLDPGAPFGASAGPAFSGLVHP